MLGQYAKRSLWCPIPASWRQPPGEETGPEAGTGIQGGQTPSPTG